MNTKTCNYLIAIEQYKTLSKAAQSLGISQPALTKFLISAELEAEHKLFDKVQKTYIPTEAGKIYLTACRKMLETEQRTLAAISRLHAPAQRFLNVGVTPYRGTQVFSRIFHSFNDRYPEIQVNLKEEYMTDMKSDLLSGQLDLAIGSLLPKDEELFSFASSSYEPMCLAVPLSHPAAARSNDSGDFFPVINFTDLSDAPFVMWGSGTTNRKLIEAYMERYHFTPTIVYESNSAILVNEMLKSGIGIGFIPRSFCKAHENRVYFSTWPPVQSFIGIFYKKGRILSTEERYFIFLLLRDSGMCNTNAGMNIYFNKISRSIIQEFGGI
ncbi:LysR family transcriptional regulator [Oribacterium sp. HCP28S3_H8]|uniref:LysR family transcriptional regulator n=1 Tax=Oribacterium sp. HCP28S3_H8 TaxID=3438945 RepID=UPI003F8B1B27